MKIIYEIDSADPLEKPIKICGVDGNTIRIEQDDEFVVFQDTAAQEIIYALKEIIGDKDR